MISTVVDVFCDPDGAYGNRLAIVHGELPESIDRPRVAADFGYSETIFLESCGDDAIVDIHTPSVQLPFAGHPLVGAAWLLRAQGTAVRSLRAPAGRARTWQENDITWIDGDPRWITEKELRRFPTPEDVDALDPLAGHGFVYCWAESGDGTIRARAFPRRGDGIVEDEATGAAALALTAQLGRDLVVTQGKGSVIHTRISGSRVAVGGRVHEVAP